MTEHIVTQKGEDIKYVVVEVVPKEPVAEGLSYQIGLLAGVTCTKVKGEEIDVNILIQQPSGGKVLTCSTNDYGISLIKSFDGKAIDFIMFHKHDKDQVSAINYATQLLAALIEAKRADLTTGLICVETYKEIPTDLLTIDIEPTIGSASTVSVVPVYEKYTILKRTASLPTKARLSAMKELVDKINAGTYEAPSHLSIVDDLTDEKKEVGSTSTHYDKYDDYGYGGNFYCG